MTGPTEASVPTIDARVEFWSGAGAQWPRSWYKHLFAGEVVHRTGRLMFGSEWSGTEPEVALFHPLQRRLDIATRPDELRWAIWLLLRNHHGYAERCESSTSSGEPPPLPLSDEWLFAVGLSQQLSNEAWASFARYKAVVELLVGLLERDVLRAALRPFFVGEPKELPAGLWYHEHYLAWFATCQIDIERPFSGVPVRIGGHWIVFDAAAFVAWESDVRMATVRHAPTQAAADGSTDESMAKSSDATTSSEATDAAVAPNPESEVKNETEDQRSDLDKASPPRQVFGKKRRPGAKPKFPWDDPRFEAEIMRLVLSAEIPRSLHHLADLMLEWCSTEWSAEPSKSRMRMRIQEVLARNSFDFP